MDELDDSTLSGLYDRYLSDYGSLCSYPRECTLFDATLNIYIKYFIPRKITPKELQHTLSAYRQSRVDVENVEFDHEHIKIRRWKPGSQGGAAIQSW